MNYSIKVSKHGDENLAQVVTGLPSMVEAHE